MAWCGKCIGVDWIWFLCIRVTSALFIISGVGCFLYIALGEPVKCWTPAHFVESHVKYTDLKCWDQNHFYLPMLLAPSVNDNDRIYLQLDNFSKWVPLFFIGFGLLAIFHFIMTSICCPSINSEMKSFVRALGKNGDSNEGQEGEDLLGNGSLLAGTTRNGSNFSGVGRRTSVIPLKVNVIITKFMAASILFLIFLLFNLMVTDNFETDGFFGMFVNDVWTPMRIPVHFLCDMKIRKLTNIMSFTFQCYSIMSLIYKYLFLFFWFWMLFVVIISGIDFVVSAIKLCAMDQKKRFVDMHMSGRILSKDMNQYSSFVRDYLSDDVILVLMRSEAQLSADKVSRALWKSWNIYIDAPPAGESGAAVSQPSASAPPNIYPSMDVKM